MTFIVECIIAFFLVLASIFLLIGAIGLIRLPDLYTRLHAPTTSSTLGLGGILIASMLFALVLGKIGFAEVLIAFLSFITAPVSANLLAQAAIHLKLRSRSGEVPETINRPLPWDKQTEE
jgi:multicomponent K+:H+ antiporter subunit G